MSEIDKHGNLDEKADLNRFVASLTNKSHDSKWRRKSAKRLARLGSPQAVGPLVGVLADKTDDIWVRLAALRAVNEIDIVSAVATLVQILRDKSDYPQVRWTSASMLRDVPSDEVVNALATVIKDNRDHIPVRFASIHAAAHIGTTESLQPLLDVVLDKSQHTTVRYSAASDLTSWEMVVIDPLEALSSILRNPGEPRRLRSSIARSLGVRGHTLKDERVLTLLLTIFNDTAEDLEVRVAAARGLQLLGDTRALGPLCEMLLDKSVPIVLRSGIAQDFWVTPITNKPLPRTVVEALTQVAEDVDEPERLRYYARNAL